MIDKSKQYRTRAGREVRIYAVDGGMNHSAVHGATFTDGYWSARLWFSDGRYINGCTHEDDLIEVKPRIKREVWVNVYGDYIGNYYRTKSEADNANAREHRIACVKLTIDCEEGEGL